MARAGQHELSRLSHRRWRQLGFINCPPIKRGQGKVNTSSYVQPELFNGHPIANQQAQPDSRPVSDVTRAISISVTTALGGWDLGTLETRSPKHLDSG